MAGERHPADVVTRDLLGLYQGAGVRLEAIVRAGLAQGLDPSRVGTDAQRVGDSTLGYRRRQLEQANAILSELDRKGAGSSSAIVTRAYSAGVVTIDQTLARGSIGGRAGVTGTFGRVHVRAVEALAGNLEASLRAASAAARQNIADVFAAADALEGALPADGKVRGVPFLGRRFDDAFRAAALAQVGEGAIALDTRRQVSQALANRLIREGTTTALTGFVDRAGRRWTLESYTAMVARTTTREAMSSSTAARMAEHGIDLVTISQHSHAADLCTPYEGRTFSLSGGHPTYPELDRRPPFHPNCRHVMAPAGANLDEYEAELEAAAAGKPEAELTPGEPADAPQPSTKPQPGPQRQPARTGPRRPGKQTTPPPPAGSRKPGELTDAELIRNAETMFGTGSKQHRAAVAKWGAKAAEPGKPSTIANLDVGKSNPAAVRSAVAGVEDVLGPAGVNVESVRMGQQILSGSRRVKAEALWSPSERRISLGAWAKTPGSAAKRAAETNRRFTVHKENAIATRTRTIAGASERARPALEESLVKIKASKRWAVYSDPDVADPVYAAAAHEAAHALDHALELQRPWKDAIKAAGVTSADQQAISDYAMANTAELFAEAYSARLVGLDLPPAITKALQTIDRLVKERARAQ